MKNVQVSVNWDRSSTTGVVQLQNVAVTGEFPEVLDAVRRVREALLEGKEPIKGDEEN